MQFEIHRSRVLIALLKGPLYREGSSELWQNLSKYEEELKEYFAHLGLSLFIHRDYGFAFLRQESSPEEASEETQALPRLVQQRELSFELSVLLALLRKKMAEHESSSSDPRLVLDQKEILEMLKIFLPASTHEVQQGKAVEALIEKAITMGVLRRLTHDAKKLEVLRVIAALFDAQILETMDQRLQEYENHAKQST